MRTARAKGLAPRIVDRRHVLRNALLPIATIIGLQTGLLLSGAVLTETVFAWPGIGTLARRGDRRPRLPGAPGRHPLRRDRLRAREPARRRLVRAHQPADPATRERRRDRGPRGRSSSRAERPLARRVAAPAPKPAARSSASRSSGLFVARGVLRAADRAVRPARPGPRAARRAAAARARPASTCSASTQLGRDELSRVVYGARYSLLIGVVVGGGRAFVRPRPRRDRRLRRRDRRQRDHAPDGHHARDSRACCSRSGSWPLLGPGLCPDHGRGRRRRRSRSSRACCAARSSPSARTTSSSPRARSACPADDPRLAHPPERDLAA